jgi:hypothetical protein
MSPSHALVQVPGKDGRMYSQYGPGQSLAAVPWVAVGLLVGDLFPKDQQGYPLRLMLGSYNALIMAGLVALFAAMGLALGYARRVVLFSGCVLAFATFLWPHSRTFFSESLVALALFASFYLLYIATAPDLSSRIHFRLCLIASGGLFALAVATKVQYVVALPAFLLYLGWRFMETRRNLKPPIFWLAGLLSGLLPLFLYNALIFGSPLSTGYGSNPGSTLTTPILQGALGLLLSPGKGLLWYAFPIVITFFGWLPFARKHRPESAFIITIFLSILTLFSLYSFWPGDGSWGPRYLTPALSFLLLPILPIVQRLTEGPRPFFFNARPALERSEGTPRFAKISMGLNHEDHEGHEEHEGYYGFESQSAQSTQRSQSAQSAQRSQRLLGVTFYFLRFTFYVVVVLGFLSNLLGVLVNFDTYINVVNDDNARYYTVDSSPLAGHLNLLQQRATEWYVDTFPYGGTTLFRSGFSYSEGDKVKGELLPRWTTGSGLLEVHPDAGGPLSMTIRLADHRPPDLPRATLSILVSGSPTSFQTIPVKDQPVSTDYSFTLQPNPSKVTIQTDTWNPSKYQAGGRNENLGLMLQSITLTQNSRTLPNTLSEALPPAPYYPQPRWYYDPGTHFLADLWPVYLVSTGMSRKVMLAIALPLLAVSFSLIFFGWRIMRTTDERVKRKT